MLVSVIMQAFGEPLIRSLPDIQMNPVPGKSPLYLASASPRRRELLNQIGLYPVALPQCVDESVRDGETAVDYVSRIAKEKALSGLNDSRRNQGWPVLAADTTVVCSGQILGKPESRSQARKMLVALSGRCHEVLTAVAIANHEWCRTTLVTSLVTFRDITEAEIEAYWSSGEPCDKAGAYAIQGLGALFVSRIEGSYTGVVGLPLFETAGLLAEFGIDTGMLLKGKRG